MWDLWFISHLVLRMIYALAHGVGGLEVILPLYTNPQRKFHEFFYNHNGDLNFSFLLVYYPILIVVLIVSRFSILKMMTYVKVKMDESI